ncbi:hypothetical protein EUX98_g6321 [Antrodiella citrinella]|uniref:Uncharacterized protein n=1 Tax=Antrodiella citrinella TaxID=2447956 RepID=A0A4S4MPE0_9APHY|nr:hypothetical protein EUX98_g6321 [Antrodiella citrinella]
MLTAARVAYALRYLNDHLPILDVPSPTASPRTRKIHAEIQEQITELRPKLGPPSSAHDDDGNDGNGLFDGDGDDDDDDDDDGPFADMDGRDEDESQHSPADKEEDRDSPANEDDGPPPNPPADDPLAPRISPLTKSAIRRVNAIVRAFPLARIQPATLLEVLMYMPSGSYAQVEDDALACLCRGYQPISFEQMNILLGRVKLSNLPPLAADLCLWPPAAVGDDAVQLLVSHERILTATHANQGSQWIFSLAKHLHVLSFAIHWGRLAGTGSQTFKTRFYKDAFSRQDHIFPAVAHVTSRTARYKIIDDQFKEEYAAWRRKNEPEITARNRYLRMYHMASFGAAVFVDTVWSVNTIVCHRSKAFGHVLNYIYDALPGPAETIFAPIHADTAMVVRMLARILGSPELESCVRRFLTDNPPLFINA